MKLVQWLSATRFGDKYQAYLNVAAPGTGGWVLHDPIFERWLKDSASTVLWCHGDRKYILMTCFYHFLTCTQLVLVNLPSRMLFSPRLLPSLIELNNAELLLLIIWNKHAGVKMDTHACSMHISTMHMPIHIPCPRSSKIYCNNLFVKDFGLQISFLPTTTNLHP